MRVSGGVAGAACGARRLLRRRPGRALRVTAHPSAAVRSTPVTISRRRSCGEYSNRAEPHKSRAAGIQPVYNRYPMKRAAHPRATDVTPVERAYQETRARILDGRYRPGAPLSELTLARAFGMSRTPVREMLTRLHQEGWVERVPSRGYFVARVTLRAIQDSFEVRRLLEGATAAAAASHATPEEVAHLRRLTRARNRRAMPAT